MTKTNAEWSAIDFINRTITRENGFTMTLIDAVEEVILQAERAQDAEDAAYGLSETLRQEQGYNERILAENKRLREAINQALEKHKWNNEESAQILEKALKESEK